MSNLDSVLSSSFVPSSIADSSLSPRSPPTAFSPRRYMHLKPAEQSTKNIRYQTVANDPNRIAQHGPQLHQPFSLLLALPAESLTPVTAFLDPVTLLSLAQANRRLSEHIKDDATWRRAFLCQFLGIRPEDDLQGEKSLLVRRSEPSWRKELIVRWKLRRLVRIDRIPIRP
jgi:hypothetical protein